MSDSIGRRSRGRAACIAFSLGVLVGGCGASQSAGAAHGPEIAIRRGTSWATYSFLPPRIIGPTADLELKNGRLRGFIAGRSMDLQIRNGEVSGYGPSGPVQADVRVDGIEAALEGQWNGKPVNFRFGPDGAKGTITVAPGRLGVSDLACSYTFDQVQSDGSLTGSTTCTGFFQDVRLHVDQNVRRIVTPSELVVFLVAALGNPPENPADFR
ncbi:MAG TPA: hypothetical protein VGG33_11495 [Polyangia bacterium]